MLRATLRRGLGGGSNAPTLSLRLAPWCHGLSTTVAKRTLTLEEAMTSSHMILQSLQSPTTVSQLSAVRNAPDTLTKWQQSNATLVQATMHVIPQVGFSHDLQGLQAYTEAFATHMRTEQPETRKALEELNQQKWAVLLKHAFACEPAPPISLSEARGQQQAHVSNRLSNLLTTFYRDGERGSGGSAQPQRQGPARQRIHGSGWRGRPRAGQS